MYFFLHTTRQHTHSEQTYTVKRFLNWASKLPNKHLQIYEHFKEGSACVLFAMICLNVWHAPTTWNHVQTRKLLQEFSKFSLRLIRSLKRGLLSVLDAEYKKLTCVHDNKSTKLSSHQLISSAQKSCASHECLFPKIK